MHPPSRDQAPDAERAGIDYRALVEQSGEITVVLDTHSAVTYVSSAVATVLGYPPSWRRVSDAFALVHPDDVERVADDFRAKLADPAGGTPITFRMRHRSGGWRHVEAVGRLVGEGAETSIVVNLRDVTQRVEAEESRLRGELQYRRALDASPEAVAIHQDGSIVFANPAAGRLLGAGSAPDLVGVPVRALVPPHAMARIAGRIEQALGGDPVELVEEQLVRLDGHLVDVAAAAVPIEWDGRPAVQVVARDLTERNQTRRELHRQATHDHLTGLPNRTLLDERLGAAEESRRRTGQGYGVVFMDLDRFKVLNDGLGHHVGDEILRQVATRLAAATGPEDTIARFGGDEFVLLVGGLDPCPDIAPVTARLAQALRAPFHIGRHEVRMRVSGGVAVVSGTGARRDALREADAAMYQAKQRGRDRFEHYDARMRDAAEERVTVEEELNRGFESGEIIVHHQAEVDLSVGRVIGTEALCRWMHPGRGLLAPGAFLGVVEDMGAATRLGDIVRARALADRAAHGRGDQWVGVNVSAAELLDEDFARRVLRDLAAQRLPGRMLCLEITESSLIADPEAAVETVAGLRSHGVAIAIDDFGTGFASLSYLQRFRPDFVKIDRSFTEGMVLDRGSRAIVRSAIEMAHAFDAIAVAEGVETAEQRDLLRELGCDLAQGYLFGRPEAPAPAVWHPG